MGLDHYDYEFTADGFHHFALPENSSLWDSPRVAENKLRSSRSQGSSTRTHVAFIVFRERQPAGLLWIVFPEMRRISDWVRNYFGTLSSTLAYVITLGSAVQSLRSFGHQIPSMADCVYEELCLQKDRLRHHGAPDDLVQYKERVCSLAKALQCKAHEVSALLAPPVAGDGSEGRSTASHLGLAPVGSWIGHARNVVMSIRRVTAEVFRVVGDPAVLEQLVNSYFFTVLHNLYDNAVKHAEWTSPGEKRIVTWSHWHQARLGTIVGNSGRPLDADPFATPSLLRRRAGLATASMLLLGFGGHLRYMPRTEVLSLLGNAQTPEGVRCEFEKCNTFFRFVIEVP